MLLGMTLNRRQFLGASALVGGAIVMTPFGRAMAAPVDPPVSYATGVSGDSALDAVLKGLPAYVSDQPLRRITIKPGTYKRTNAIIVPSGVYLEVTNATFILQTRGIHDAVLRIQNVTDVTIDGGMWDANKKIVKAKTEWRHAIVVHHSTNVTLQNLHARNGKGDGIYIGTDASPCSNVVVKNVDCFGNTRSGLAITACDGFKAMDSRFHSNSGHAPEAGVVIEPHDTSVIDNIEFFHCQFDNNASRGFHVVMHAASGYPVGTGIEVANCTMTNNGRKSKDQSTAGIALLRPRLVTIKNCYTAGNSNGVFILGRRPGDPSTVKGDVKLLENCRVTGNLKDGIIIQNSIKSLAVESAQIVNNSRKKRNTYDGVRIKQGATVVQVTNSTVTGHRYGVCADKGVSQVTLTSTTLMPNKKGKVKGAGVTVN
jgi:hypothetical protein